MVNKKATNIYTRSENNKLNKIRNEKYDKLFDAILALKTRKECYDFFEDICTFKEVDAMSVRLEAAKLLMENNTYDDILQSIDISSATLSRVSKCMKYGPGGYRTILERLAEKEKSDKGKEE